MSNVAVPKGLQLEYIRTQIMHSQIMIQTVRETPAPLIDDLSNPLNFKPPKRTIELEDGEGTRTITIDAEPVTAAGCRPYQGPKLPIPANSLAFLSWSRAIRKLPDYQQSWLRYCYGSRPDYDDQVILTHHVWNALSVDRTLPKMNKTTLSIMRPLAYLAVQASKSVINSSYVEYTASELAHLSGVSKNAWNISYQPRWELLMAICQEVDKEALYNASFRHKRDE